jgi:hypothetical protein
MALSDQSDLAVYPPFVRRVEAATVAAAVAIGNEAYDGSQTAIARRALSQRVLVDPNEWGEIFAWAIASNTAITIASADSDIEWTIGSVWNAIAGALPEQSTPAAPTS